MMSKIYFLRMSYLNKFSNDLNIFFKDVLNIFSKDVSNIFSKDVFCHFSSQGCGGVMGVGWSLLTGTRGSQAILMDSQTAPVSDTGASPPGGIRGTVRWRNISFARLRGVRQPRESSLNFSIIEKLYKHFQTYK